MSKTKSFTDITVAVLIVHTEKILEWYKKPQNKLWISFLRERSLSTSVSGLNIFRKSIFLSIYNYQALSQRKGLVDRERERYFQGCMEFTDSKIFWEINHIRKNCIVTHTKSWIDLSTIKRVLLVLKSFVLSVKWLIITQSKDN